MHACNSQQTRPPDSPQVVAALQEAAKRSGELSNQQTEAAAAALEASEAMRTIDLCVGGLQRQQNKVRNISTECTSSCGVVLSPRRAWQIVLVGRLRSATADLQPVCSLYRIHNLWPDPRGSSK